MSFSRNPRTARSFLPYGTITTTPGYMKMESGRALPISGLSGVPQEEELLAGGRFAVSKLGNIAGKPLVTIKQIMDEVSPSSQDETIKLILDALKGYKETQF
jgi:hypothetical protein